MKPYRMAFLIVTVLLFLNLTQGYVSYTTSERPIDTIKEQASVDYEQRKQIFPESNHSTVVTFQTGRIIAFYRNGKLLYFDNEYQNYWDVDPISTDEDVVLYVASNKVQGSQFVNVIEKSQSVFRYERTTLQAHHGWKMARCRFNRE